MIFAALQGKAEYLASFTMGLAASDYTRSLCRWPCTATLRGLAAIRRRPERHKRLECLPKLKKNEPARTRRINALMRDKICETMRQKAQLTYRICNRPRFKPWKRVRLPWERRRIESELRYRTQNNGIFRSLHRWEYEGCHRCVGRINAAKARGPVLSVNDCFQMIDPIRRELGRAHHISPSRRLVLARGGLRSGEDYFAASAAAAHHSRRLSTPFFDRGGCRDFSIHAERREATVSHLLLTFSISKRFQ